MPRPSSREDRPRRRAALRPEVAALEPRQLLSTTVSVLEAKPQLLTPPNGRIVKVEVSGFVVESRKKFVPTARFHLIDEYRRDESSGPVKLERIAPTAFSFKFSIFLSASRADSDLSGRQYHLVVGSQDDDNAGGKVLTILVPHDAKRKGKGTERGPGNAGGAGAKHPIYP